MYLHIQNHYLSANLISLVKLGTNNAQPKVNALSHELNLSYLSILWKHSNSQTTTTSTNLSRIIIYAF